MAVRSAVERIAARVKQSEGRLDAARHAVSSLTREERERFLVELIGVVEHQADTERRERVTPERAPGDTRTWHLAGENGRTLCRRSAEGLRIASGEAETDTLCSRCRREAEWRASAGAPAEKRPRRAPSVQSAVERVLAESESRPLGAGEVFERARKLLPGVKVESVNHAIDLMRAENPPRIVQADVGPHGPLYVLATGGAAVN
jgi:hypothetical protein